MSAEPELFGPEAGAMLSPKMRWLRDHDLETHELPNGGQEGEDGDPIPKWACCVRKPKSQSGLFTSKEIGGGDTEDEAIADYATNAGVRLWFEEDL